jgi:hypothetical protein
MSVERPRTVRETHRGREHVRKEKPFDRGRCPECGTEDGVYTASMEKWPPIPPNYRARCPECEHQGDPHGFEWAYRRERMSEDELQKAHEQAEEARDEMADWQYSAHHHSLQREP